VQPDSIDLLISACAVPEQALPSTACLIACQAGLPAGTPAFDVNASCLSFLSAMEVAGALLATGRYRRIAVVSTDLASRGIDWAEPDASLIFGDGAAAVILDGGTQQQGIRAFRLATYPEGRTYCEIRAGGTARNPRVGVTPQDYLFRMDGKAVFKLAARVLPNFLRDLLAAADTDLASIDLLVPHQASQLGLAHAAKLLNVPPAKIMDIYATHGNQVAASIPTALHEALISGRARSGQRILLMGTAAGLSVGGMVLDL
jgi:3-oxoacyl-[acyl-carrier-protein] synthase-3